MVNQVEFDFDTTIPNGNTIYIEAVHSNCTGACASGSVTASYKVNATPTKTSAQDAYVKIDMSGAIIMRAS